MGSNDHYLKNELYGLIKTDSSIFEFLQKGSLDGIWYWDLERPENEWMSHQFWEILGYKPEEKKHLASEWQDLINPDDLEGVLENFKKHCDDPNHPFDQVVRYRHKNNSTVWVRCRGIAIRDENNTPIRMLGAHNELTKIKESEAALQKSEERFRSYFMNDQTVKLTIDLKNGKIQDANHSALHYYGYDKQEITNKTIFDINVLPHEVVSKRMAQTAKNQKNYFLMQHRLANGEIRDVQVFATPLKLKDQTVSISTIYDITDQNLAKQEQKKLQAQLFQAQKMESVGRLAGGVAHDFNNMLSVIIGQTEMAMEEEHVTQPVYEMLEEIRAAAMRSSNLTRQLLAFARKQTISPKILDLNKTIEDMTSMLHRLMGENIYFAWHPGDNLWPVKADPSQIDQILANLCVNARDAIEDVGKVTIETGNATLDETYNKDHPGSSPGEYVFIAVSDNGCGISSENMDNIFEPFFTTKESGEGTGLGLATVYGAVKQNGGFIDIRSESGKGTTCTIYLPRNHSEEDVRSKKRRNVPIAHGSETILLVEDESAILKMTKQMLERTGYNVIAAKTPVEAIRQAEEHVGKVHLLLTDVVMPEMNGRDLAQKILTIYPSLKHLFMSGYTADVIAHHGILDEDIDFIQKPFTRKELATKIREMLDTDKI